MKKASPATAPRSVPLSGQGTLRLRTETGVISVRCLWKRSVRARHLRLTIDRQNQVVVTLPPRCPVERGFRFVETKAEWVVRHLASRPPPETLAAFLARKRSLTAHGRNIPLLMRANTKNPAFEWKPAAGHIRLAHDDGRHGEAVLVAMLRDWAAEVLAKRTLDFAARHGLRVKRVTVRDQASRWGSCSSKGTVSLNWRLILLPPVIQDYVILHELAHLKVMNHSDRYWLYLQGLDARAAEHDAELSRLASQVMGLGRRERLACV